MTPPERRTQFRPESVPVVAVAAYVVALLAWLALLTRRVPMPGSGAAMDPGAPGVVEAMGTAGGSVGVAVYLLMWTVMMVAMMYPSSAGVFQWYSDGLNRFGPTTVAASVLAFVGTYTLVWTGVGIVPLVVNAVVPISPLARRWGTLYFGAAFLAVAAFQLSPFKRGFLDRCRSPTSWLGTHYAPGVHDAVRHGWAFALQDLGACGVPMGLMVVLGSMNVRWMALIAVALSLERLTPRGDRWARAFGLLAGVAGLLLVVSWLG